MYQLSGKSQIMTNDETLKVYRQTTTLVYGKPVANLPILQFSIECNVQPCTGRDLLLVPEGDREKENLWVYSTEIEKPVRLNDKITRWSKGLQMMLNYQVQNVETWGEAPNGYQKIRMTLDDVGPNNSSNPE
jgi:hypothetical protein